MDDQGGGESSSSIQQPPWIPQTPIKPIAPIYPNRNQTEERGFIGNKDMSSLDHLSFGDLLALANTASSVLFSGQAGINKRKVVCGEMMPNNEAMESLSSVINNVGEDIIKTPEKPKRKKHRPKVVREPKPTTDPKPKTPRKPTVKGQESNTPKTKSVRKKKEVNKDQESTPLQESAAGETSTRPKRVCRRALDFEDMSFKPENQLNSSCTKHADEMESVCSQNMHWLYLKDWEQKGMRSNTNTSFSGQGLVVEQDVSTFDSKGYSFTSQASAFIDLTMEEDCRTTFQGRQSFESNVGLDKINTPTKKRTTGHARFRNLSAINKATEVSQKLQARSYRRPQSNKNVPVKPRVTSIRKKRITKSQKSQTNQLTVYPRQFPASFAGLSPEQVWIQRGYTVEAISEHLRVLDINRENSETALVPFAMNTTGSQLIIFGGAGAIVPSAPVKKRRARAKVDLDNETDKMWKLLMENIDSEGVNGSDEQKAKWWEEERNVFRGRADSFIARMHLVQGDRRFTPWKGSVVDSVVGVFLTQNVSDHLSSSAFMSLASEFPVPVVPSSDFEVGTSSMPSIRITYLDSEESISNPPTVNNTQPGEEKDHVNSNDTSRSSSEIASSGHESVFKTMDSKAQVDSDRTGSSVEVNKTDQTYLVQDLFPSEDSAVTCQSSLVSDAPKNTERVGSSSEINSKGEPYDSYTKLVESLRCAELNRKRRGVITADTVSVEESNQKNQCSRQEVGGSSSPGSLQVSPNTSPGDCCSEVKDFKSDDSNEPCCCFGDVLSVQKPKMPESSSSVLETSVSDINESTNCLDVQEGTGKQPGPDSMKHMDAKGKKVLKEEKEGFDWDGLRREAQGREGKREKTSRTMDSVDWEAIRTADVSEVAETIKSRGMNHKLAERIQGFLNRLLTEHGSLDLEWLRDVPPDKTKEYLLSFRGLGLKSVECVRLLTLHHLAFPVDTNVGRIAVRLGWVPLQPLPESLQLHLLEMYPVLESIQKYLWPRLCKLDQKTLYELHYQMITFGKVFCTKSKPNCNACPMRGECRHFASAFASARLALPGSEKGMGTPDVPLYSLPEPLRRQQGLEVVKHSEGENRVTSCEPIIEEPASPEPVCTQESIADIEDGVQVSIADIEDAFYEDPEEIPTIRLNMDAFTSNLKKIMEHNKELGDGNMSTALVALTAEAASLPMPKLKNISQLRTEHQVYELPDTHPLLAEFEKREGDDPCSYLLAIWTPGETVDSVQPAVSKCISQDIDRLCDEETCFSCNSIKEARSQTVRGTILIPCRTAMRGSFPLNGTYFQVNEVFADHDSSLTPIDVPRDWLWNLARRTVYFGTSIPTIFKGLSTETIQQCFWRGYVCVRGFERKTRAPRPLIARLHFPVSKMKSQANPGAA